MSLWRYSASPLCAALALVGVSCQNTSAPPIAPTPITSSSTPSPVASHSLDVTALTTVEDTSLEDVSEAAASRLTVILRSSPGGPLQKTRVTVAWSGCGKSGATTLTTDSSGRIVVSGIPNGICNLVVSSAGYADKLVNGIRIPRAQVLSVTLQKKLGDPKTCRECDERYSRENALCKAWDSACQQKAWDRRKACRLGLGCNWP